MQRNLVKPLCVPDDKTHIYTGVLIRENYSKGIKDIKIMGDLYK